MKFTAASSFLFLIVNSLVLSSLPTTTAVSALTVKEKEVDVMQHQDQDQQQRKLLLERQLLLKCDRICIFWCHCSDYTCSTKGGDTGGRVSNRMMEMVGLDPDTTNLDLLSNDELRELEWKAQDILVHDTNAVDEHHHHRALLGLFGTCENGGSDIYVARYLSNEQETEDTIPKNPEYALQLITDIGGNPEATYSYQHNVLNNDEANRIIDYMETHPQKQYKTKQFSRTDTYELYHVDMTGTEFVPLIGKERMQQLINLMQIRATPDHPYLPITGIRGAYLPPDPNKHMAYHMDEHKVTLLIALNEGFEGGEIVYLTGKEGAILHARSVGSAFLHGSDIVHGVTSHDGKGRYVLYILSDMDEEADPALTEEALSSMV